MGVSLDYNDIHDQSLEDVRRWGKMWPLVKSVTSYMGSVLLEHELCLQALMKLLDSAPYYRSANQAKASTACTSWSGHHVWESSELHRLLIEFHGMSGLGILQESRNIWVEGFTWCLGLSFETHSERMTVDFQ